MRQIWRKEDPRRTLISLKDFIEPRKPEELTALSRLMNLPADVVSELLCDFEKLAFTEIAGGSRMTRTTYPE